MSFNARSHFLHLALPAFQTFVSYYSGREMGLHQDSINAARVAEALRDLPEHAFQDPSYSTGYSDGGCYRESFWPDSWSYQLTCNFADAWKHGRLDRKVRLISSLGNLTERLLVIRCEDDQGFYYACRKLLALEADEGPEYDLAEHLFISMKLWSKELKRRGVISTAPALTALPSYYQTRLEAKNAVPMRILAHTNEDFELMQRHLILEAGSTTPRALQKNDIYAVNCDIILEALPSPLDGQMPAPTSHESHRNSAGVSDIHGVR